MQEAMMRIVTTPEEIREDTIATAELLLAGVPGGVALEIGAGVGRLMREMSSHLDYVWGVDLSESMVKLSKEFLRDHPRCKVLLGDGHSLPFASDKFDFVYSYITFQHMPDLRCVQDNIQEAFRVLKPGGFIRVQTIQGKPFDGPYGTGGFAGYNFENADAFKEEFLKAGFTGEAMTIPYAPIPSIGIIWFSGRKPE